MPWYLLLSLVAMGMGFLLTVAKLKPWAKEAVSDVKEVLETTSVLLADGKLSKEDFKQIASKIIEELYD